MTLHDPVAGSSRLRFVKTGNAAFLFLIAPIDQVGNRIRSMGTSGDRCGMVGKDHHGIVAELDRKSVV